MNWRILSSGPSIKHLDELPGEGPIVAINHAILHPIEADHWCCHEYGRGVEDTLIKKTKGPKLETWVGEGYLHKWMTWNPKRGMLYGVPALTLVPHPNDDEGFRRAFLNSQYGWETECAWGRRSFFAALANCVLRGATRIECWGVDMTGSVNSGGGPAGALTRQRYRQRTNPDFQRRPYEQKSFLKIIQEAAEHGVEIVRMTV